jgi:uncharacterized coiled-coil DUF342 family protein
MNAIMEQLIKRTTELEASYYDLQAKYQELIHQHEELKANRNEMKDRYENECG